MKFEIFENLKCCNDYEIIWLKFNLLRILCGFLCIILGFVYYFGWISFVEFDFYILNDYFFESLILVEVVFFNCGIIFIGDFNCFNISCL